MDGEGEEFVVSRGDGVLDWLDVRIIIIIIWGCYVRWLPPPSLLLVHGPKDTVHYNVGLAAAMVHGELQRMRSDGLVDGCWWFDDVSVDVSMMRIRWRPRQRLVQ